MKTSKILIISAFLVGMIIGSLSVSEVKAFVFGSVQQIPEWMRNGTLIKLRTETNNVRVGANGALFVDTTNNRVGIATTTPGYTLDVQGTTNISGNLTLPSLTSGSVLFTGASGLVSQDNANLFWDNTNKRLGIGTMSPGAKLHIEGGEFWLFNNGNNPRIVIGDNGATGQYGYLGWDSNNDYYRIETEGTNGFKIKGNYVSVGNIYPSQPLIVGLGTTELFRVDSSGNVGIGTTDPQGKLHIYGGSLVINGGGLDGSNYQKFVLYVDTTHGLYFDAPKDSAENRLPIQFNWRGGGTPPLYISGGASYGNVGIGTTNPQHKLDVEGYVQAYGYYTGDIIFRNNGEAVWKMFEDETSLYTQSLKTGQNVLTIKDSGNVGIGTTSPIGKLMVQGAVTGKALTILNETGDQALLTASASGTPKFTIAHNGLVNATAGGLATYTKAGIISDTDFADAAVDGLIAFDSTDGRLYIRNGGSWSYIAKTAGFQIPDYEASGFQPGDLLLPYVEKIMADGAVHGLYKKLDINELLNSQALTFKTNVEFQGPSVFKALAEFFNNVIFHNPVFFAGPVKFSQDTAGVAVISAYTNQVDVKFKTPYETPPVVTISLVIPDSKDPTFQEEGAKAAVTNVTTSGFSIILPNLAVRDFTYNWTAIAVDQMTTTKSTSVIQNLLENQNSATPSAVPVSPSITQTPTPTPTAAITPTATPTPPLPTASTSAEISPTATP